ncbi:hypothetical protein WISP_134761 [Willisornis vidua]|uniref:Gfo/Idh/MocA-like oxidoreductase N-terminal domain-containing protein n=1 Tax=Willisornis vidua TaxID=1566151 RepID=A0ABQ9CTY2_9PASS|nr:hypothetical protein WISP_134761 [Willisornis vidua]
MLPGVGVFGTGLTARVIVPLLKAEGFAVKALWGRTPEEAEELAKEMSVPFYTSRIDEVLLHQDVDLVCVNLPPPLTRQVAVKTLESQSKDPAGNQLHVVFVLYNATVPQKMTPGSSADLFLSVLQPFYSSIILVKLQQRYCGIWPPREFSWEVQRKQADHMDYTLVIEMSVNISIYSLSVDQKSPEQTPDGLVLGHGLVKLLQLAHLALKSLLEPETNTMEISVGLMWTQHGNVRLENKSSI